MNFNNEALTISTENILKNVSEAESLVTVNIPAGTDSIGDYAFEEVGETLQAVYIPNSVSGISPTAFHGCDKMRVIFCDFTKAQWEEITLNTPNIYLPLECKFYFTDCVMENTEKKVLLNPQKPEILQAVNHYVTEVAESYISEVAAYAAEDCWDLSEVSLGTPLNKISSLGKGTFKNCYALRTFTLYTSASIVPESFMEGCESIQKLIIPESIFVIEKKAFRDCGMMDVNLNNATCIGEDAFSECRNLRQVILPRTMKCVAINAFANCNNLRSITINKEIQYLSDSFRGSPISEIIFTGTRAQFSKKFGAGFMTISPEALIFCHDGILQNGEVQIKNKALVGINEMVDELEVPEGVEVINPCFHLNVKRLVLPSTIKELGDELWLGNTDIEIYYNGTIAAWQRVKKGFTFFDPYNLTAPGTFTTISCLDGDIKEFYRKPYDELEWEADCEQVSVL